MDYLVEDFTKYYNLHRSHMRREQLPPVRKEPQEVETIPIDEIEVESIVAGLVKGAEREVD